MTRDCLTVARPVVRAEDVFELLSDRDRRLLVDFLRETSQDELLVEDLVDALDDGATPDRRERLHINIVHRHLPLLRGAGLVEIEDEMIVPQEPIPDTSPVVSGAEQFVAEYQS